MSDVDTPSPGDDENDSPDENDAPDDDELEPEGVVGDMLEGQPETGGAENEGSAAG